MAHSPVTRIPTTRRSLTSETLVCPRCQSRLVPKLQQEIEVDVCPLCQGVWLDRNELDQLLAAALWEVDRYAARMAELPSVAAATSSSRSHSASDGKGMNATCGNPDLGENASWGASDQGRGVNARSSAPQPTIGQVLSRFKNNFGRFLGKLKQTG